MRTYPFFLLHKLHVETPRVLGEGKYKAVMKDMQVSVWHVLILVGRTKICERRGTHCKSDDSIDIGTHRWFSGK